MQNDVLDKIKFWSVIPAIIRVALILFLVLFYRAILISLTNALATSEEYCFALLLLLVSCLSGLPEMAEAAPSGLPACMNRVKLHITFSTP
jgi:hypothetical protein